MFCEEKRENVIKFLDSVHSGARHIRPVATTLRGGSVFNAAKSLSLLGIAWNINKIPLTRSFTVIHR